MSGDRFELAEEAILDNGIWLYLLEREGLELADRIVSVLFKSFLKLADTPNIGHRRPDLTRHDVLFHRTFSYLIVYAPGTDPLQILSVLHSKRNAARLLRERL